MLKKVTPIQFDCIDSTHAFIKRSYSDFNLNTITRVMANSQTHGHGRTQKKWISPPSHNLYLSYFLALSKDQPDLTNLAQVLGVILVQLLKCYHIHAEIKWPNDILIKQKKVAGSLCEWIDLQEHLGVILSIGLNVNMPQNELSTIDQPATSMRAESGLFYSLTELAAQLDLLITTGINHYISKGFSFFYSSYDAYLFGKGLNVTYLQKKLPHTATIESVNFDGRLNIRLSSGEVKKLDSRDIDSIRFF